MGISDREAIVRLIFTAAVLLVMVVGHYYANKLDEYNRCVRDASEVYLETIEHIANERIEPLETQRRLKLAREIHARMAEKCNVQYYSD